MRKPLLTVLAGLAGSAGLLLAASTPASAGKPGGGTAREASCSVSLTDSVVSAVNLPTGEVVNFMVTDSTGTTGWVLGMTDDGSWNVAVPAANGPTTYEFVSKTWGKGGSKYTVFATCGV